MQRLYSVGISFLCLLNLLPAYALAAPTSRPHTPPASRPSTAHSSASSKQRTQKWKELSQQLNGKKWRTRYDATQKLGKWGQKKGWSTFGQWAPQIQTKLKHIVTTDKEFWVRAGVAKAFGFLGGEQSILLLVAILQKDKQAEVRHAAIEALERIGTQTRNKKAFRKHQKVVISALKQVMNDRSVQFTAAKALEKLTGDPLPLVELSVHTVLYGSNLVRGLVSLSFRKLSIKAKKRAIPLLIEALAQASSSNLNDVIGAIVMTGKLAIPALKKASKHNHPSIRSGAQKALRILLKKK